MEVNAFWADQQITVLETLCMQSFLANGIAYNLYCYEKPAGLPTGISVLDAARIVPRDRLFRYSAGEFNTGSVSGFSNLFRYTLINAIGGWWVDTDVCCLDQFEVSEREWFLRAPTKAGEFYVASAIYKAPPQSSVLRECLRVFGEKDVTQITHGETGPRLLTSAIQQTRHESAVHPSERFFPVPWWDFDHLFNRESIDLSACATVHFWNAMITNRGLDKNARFARGSVFESLKARYL